MQKRLVSQTSYTCESVCVVSLCRRKKERVTRVDGEERKGIEGERKRLLRIQTGFTALTQTQERVAALAVGIGWL